MIAFRKYHGCGNNFIIVQYEHVKHYDFVKLAKHVCDMHEGIGADGCIIVKTNPLEMLFYNQDGSMAPMCGNGIRCFAKYVCDMKLVDESQFMVKTGAGDLLIQVEKMPFQASVKMGSPEYNHEKLKLVSTILNCKQYNIDEYVLHSVFMGTIHTVLFVDDVKQFDCEGVGSYLCNHPTYLEKSNINFVEIKDANTMEVVTYERGVGITKACGTGCCASVVIANDLHKVDSEVNVQLELGVLHIQYKNNMVEMKGPATFVAEGMCSIYQEEN